LRVIGNNTEEGFEERKVLNKSNLLIIRKDKMARREKVSFLAKTKVKKRVSFETKEGPVSFDAESPSKRRKRITFYAKKKK